MDRTKLLSLIHTVADAMEFVSADILSAADRTDDTETLERLLILLVANLRAESQLTPEDRDRLSDLRQQFIEGTEAIYRSEYLSLMTRIERERERAPEVLQECLSAFAFV